MKTVIQIKLNIDNQQKQALLDTMLSFNKACNYISAYAFEKQIFSKYKIQEQLYYDLKEKYHLSSQLLVRAIDKVVSSYKSTKNYKTLHIINPKSAVVYDSRILSYSEDYSTCSIWTVNGRLRLPISIYDKNKLQFFKGQADLVYKKNNFYLIQTLDIPEQEMYAPNAYIGVDLGITRIATDSTGEYYSGQVVEQKRMKYAKHRSSLQSKGTQSAKRRLKKISKREHNFRKDINHQISKKLVQKAKDTHQGIKLEELVNFFDKKKVRKSERSNRHSWSFRQLREFIQYKALLAGVQVILVNPAYTSQQCSNCGYTDKSNRKTQSEFFCQCCGFAANADYNASINISRKAVVNQPIVSTPKESDTSPAPCGRGN